MKTYGWSFWKPTSGNPLNSITGCTSDNGKDKGISSQWTDVLETDTEHTMTSSMRPITWIEDRLVEGNELVMTILDSSDSISDLSPGVTRDEPGSPAISSSRR